MNIAVIPARGGSKRIPRKNIKEFYGKPMIAWSIETAYDSGCFDHIVVSTDDDEIAEVAKYYGAEVPFMRPQAFADDMTAIRPVVNHAISEAAAIWGSPDYVCCIYATAPFLLPEDLRSAFDRLRSANVDFIFSAGAFPSAIKRGFRLTKNGTPERIYPEHRYTRSQDLEVVYHDAGQFNFGKTESFLNGSDAISAKGIIHLIQNYRVHDIDTEEDWLRAELFFKLLNGNSII